MAGYEKFVKELGINFEWKINRDTKKLEYMMQISCKPFGVISEIL